MPPVTIKQLLEAGVHFGHQTQRWNPKMKKYIFGERNGIYIINLELTLQCLQKAGEFLQKVAAEGREILLIGTKKQAKAPLKEAALRCGMPYVEERWLGGALTNFETVRKSVARLDHIDKMEQEGGFRFITKKEASILKKERERLKKNLQGVREMKRLPRAIFVIDAKKEEIALREAAKLGIPVVAVLDTNCDPDGVAYPLPGNDDAIRAIRLFCDFAAEHILEGRRMYLQSLPADQREEEAVAQEAEEPVEAAPDAPESEAEAPAPPEPVEEVQEAAPAEPTGTKPEGPQEGEAIPEDHYEQLVLPKLSETPVAPKAKTKKKQVRKEGRRGS